MVTIVKTDRTRSHVSTRSLEGRSSERGVTIDASLCMIGWGRVLVYDRLGAGPCCVILQEDGFLPMSESSILLMLKFQMSIHIAGIQKESMFMITLIGLGGVHMV